MNVTVQPGTGGDANGRRPPSPRSLGQFLSPLSWKLTHGLEAKPHDQVCPRAVLNVDLKAHSQLAVESCMFSPGTHESQEIRRQ